MREFDGGATRDDANRKLAYTGFLEPRFLNGYAHYMHKHRATANGVRGADNWKSGFPTPVLLDSLVRHVMDVWMLLDGNQIHDATNAQVSLADAIMGAVFNLQGLWCNYNRSNEIARDGEPLA